MSIAEIKNPGEVVCTMKFTMKLKDWKEVRDALDKEYSYPKSRVVSEIQDLVYQLEKTLYADKGEQDD